MTGFVVAAVTLGLLAVAGLVWPRRAEAPGGRPTTRLCMGLGVAVVLVAAGGYLALGSPSHLLAVPDDEALQATARELQRRLDEQPDDAASWAQLARAHAALGHGALAAQAFERAAALRPHDAGLLVDHADFIARVRGAGLGGEPSRLVERALAIDPRHAQALALAGAAAFDRGAFEAAAQYWDRLAEVQSHDAALVQKVRARAEQARQLAAGTTPQGKAPTGEGGASGVREPAGEDAR